MARNIKENSIFIRKEDYKNYCFDNHHNADIVRVIESSLDQVFFNKFIAKTHSSTKTDGWKYDKNKKNFLKKYKKIKLGKVCTIINRNNVTNIKANEKYFYRYATDYNDYTNIWIIGCDNKRKIVYFAKYDNFENKMNNKNYEIIAMDARFFKGRAIPFEYKEVENPWEAAGLCKKSQ